MPSATPNYITVLPDGSTGADFPGGVTIIEGPSSSDFGTIQQGHAVTWKRESDGAAVAQVAAKHTGSTPDGAQMWVQARSPDQAMGAGISANAIDGGAGSDVSAFVGGYPPGAETLLLLAQNSPGEPAYSEVCRVFNLHVQTGSDIFHAPSANVFVNNAAMRLLVAVSTSAYCVGPTGLFVYQIFWDGTPLNPTQKFFFNNTGVHHTLPVIAVEVPGLVSPGVHTLGMTSVTGTTAAVTADTNDGYTIITVG